VRKGVCLTSLSLYIYIYIYIYMRGGQPARGAGCLTSPTGWTTGSPRSAPSAPRGNSSHSPPSPLRSESSPAPGEFKSLSSGSSPIRVIPGEFKLLASRSSPIRVISGPGAFKLLASESPTRVAHIRVSTGRHWPTRSEDPSRIFDSDEARLG
jgi:hypothetical protein